MRAKFFQISGGIWLKTNFLDIKMYFYKHPGKQIFKKNWTKRKIKAFVVMTSGSKLAPQYITDIIDVQSQTHNMVISRIRALERQTAITSQQIGFAKVSG